MVLVLSMVDGDAWCASFAKYGNGMSLDEWRRENVNAMIKSSYDMIKIKKAKGCCLFVIKYFSLFKYWTTYGGAVCHTERM